MSVLNRKTRYAAVAIAAAFAISLSSCSSTSGSTSTAASKSCSNFSFLVNDATIPWNGTMAKGAEDQAKKLDVKLNVVSADNNNATQISQVKQALAGGVCGILLQAVDSAGIVPAIKQAQAQNVPVVVVNSGVASSAQIVTFVGADQVAYGKAAAELTEKALPDGGTVALIQGGVGNPVEVARTKGFKDEIASNSKIKVVIGSADNWTNSDNLASVQNLLTKYPKGQLDAIVAEGPQIYVGAKYAAKIGRTDVKFIGGDFPVQVKDAISSGTMFGTVLQDGAQQGIAGVKAVYNWTNDKQSDVKRPIEYVDLPLITKDNVDQFSTSWNA